jgi:CheY-like chemotaxis protein
LRFAVYQSFLRYTMSIWQLLQITQRLKTVEKRLRCSNVAWHVVSKRGPKPMGVSYDFAEDGKIAVSRFSAALHDAVLMDVSMPNMEGAQATRQIRALEFGVHATDRTPIIAVTAFVGRDEKAALA